MPVSEPTTRSTLDRDAEAFFEEVERQYPSGSLEADWAFGDQPRKRRKNDGKK